MGLECSYELDDFVTVEGLVGMAVYAGTEKTKQHDIMD